MDADFDRRRYDLSVGLADARPIETIEGVLAAVPGIGRAEFWPGASPYLIGPGGAAITTVSLPGVEPGSASSTSRWSRTAGSRRATGTPPSSTGR